MSSALPPRSSQPKAESANSPVSSEAEKDNYTLDEMMKALRDGERERESTGEVVTRADGSVVHKVRRRKRRSDQPEKAKQSTPEKKKKRFMWKLVICVSLFLFAVLGALFTIVGYNSKSYREKVEERASSWTGADVDLDGLKLMPGQITMTGASFEWPESSYLQDLTIRNLSGHADFTSFIWARLGGRELGGKVGVLNLQMPSGNQIVGENLEEEDFPFNFQGYYCDALDVNFGQESLFSIKGTDTSFRYISGAGFRMSLDQGMLTLDGWEDFPIDNAVLKFSSDEVNLETLNLGVPGTGQGGVSGDLKLSGIIPLVVGEQTQLNFQTGSFPLRSLFGTQMGSLFTGKVSETKDGKVGYTFGQPSYDEVSFEFDAFQVELHKFPFLSNLDVMFPQEGYSELIFDNEIGGIFRADSRGVAIHELKMGYKDILKLRGDILISKSGKIGGLMTLSINHGLISSEASVQSLPAFAGKENKAYHTVQFKLGGTLEEPNDSFREVIGLISTKNPSNEPSRPSVKEQWEKMLKEGE